VPLPPESASCLSLALFDWSGPSNANNVFSAAASSIQ
jgi:hypothetical protein